MFSMGRVNKVGNVEVNYELISRCARIQIRSDSPYKFTADRKGASDRIYV